MEAFSNGVRLGGLYNTQDIKILICYMLMGVEKMPRDAIVQILSSNEIANLFETSAAIDDLVTLGNLVEDADGDVTLTENGRLFSSELVKMIPYTLREQSHAAAVQLLARMRHEQQSKVDIHPMENGYEITCAIDTTEHPMMSFSLRVADQAQAELIRDQFLNDPLTIYRTMVAMLTGAVKQSEEDGRTVLRLSM